MCMGSKQQFVMGSKSPDSLGVAAFSLIFVIIVVNVRVYVRLLHACSLQWINCKTDICMACCVDVFVCVCVCVCVWCIDCCQPWNSTQCSAACVNVYR